MLGNTSHPVGLRRLATSGALLSGDPLTRMTLPELLVALEQGEDEGEDEDGVLQDAVQGAVQDDVEPGVRFSSKSDLPQPRPRRRDKTQC